MTKFLEFLSGRFRRKRTKYPSRIKPGNKVKMSQMSDFNTYWYMNDQAFNLILGISIFLCFTDVTRVSEGHGYSSYYDEFPLKDSFKLLDSI